MNIIGREREKQLLQSFFDSEQPEFVVVYGRRRVGKTFLIKEFFKQRFTFYFTGVAKSNKHTQLKNFNDALQSYSKTAYPRVNSWMDAFRQLIHFIENTKTKGKKIVFIDELPWLDTHASKFITALELFWNSWASSREDILLIVCGSATSWMTDKLLKNKGGLHNRATQRINLQPFTLRETAAFFYHRKLNMTKQDVLDAYMVFGGIPFYLNMFDKGLSVAQNIDRLCFAKSAPLKDEFYLLYNSLFENSENYIEVVGALSKKNMGVTRDEIIKLTGIQGGGLTTVLENLELSGFINIYNSFNKKTKERIYQLSDFFSLFYMKFMKKNKNALPEFWEKFIENATYKAWKGYAFEQVCTYHISNILKALEISGVITYASAWRSCGKEEKTQIDLLIDRNDNVINICEMKYANSCFVVDKKLDENLRRKRSIFIHETKTRKAVHLTMVTPFGIKHNEYWNGVQSEVTMDDLFR
ncbi:MAG: ATP-binding protein [Bacteroidales bacterium]|jgi:AAA+ ATPase superfamily predicted ATPase|nr:ATP-binding protein [Bacteroidales bacterium]